MKKLLPLLVLASATTAMAEMPRFPDLARIQAARTSGTDIELTDQEKAEAGAFLLFYELAKDGLIGGNDGLCVDWQPGDNAGSPGKISIGLPNEEFFQTGKSILKPGMEANAAKLNTLLERVKIYLDSGCAGDAACLQNRTLSFTGYADGQAFGSNAQASLANNQKLSLDRAKAVSDLLTVQSFNRLPAQGFNSPNGERQRIAGNKNYRVDCPERRVTVVDVGFNASGVETSGGNGKISPAVFAASGRFVKLSNMAAGMQILKAAGNGGKPAAITTDEQADAVVAQVMRANGVSDENLIRSCQNIQSRTMVKEHVRKFLSRTPEIQSDLLAQFAKGEEAVLKIVGANKNTPENKQLIAYYNKMAGFGGIEDKSRYPEIATSGQSTSLNDCFSAKGALKAEMAIDPNLTKRMCKPISPFMRAGSSDLEINYHPKELDNGQAVHIGCTACTTGFRFEPSTVVDTNTGQERKVLLATYRDREFPGGAPRHALVAPSYFDQNVAGTQKKPKQVYEDILKKQEAVAKTLNSITPTQKRSRFTFMNRYLNFAISENNPHSGKKMSDYLAGPEFTEFKQAAGLSDAEVAFLEDMHNRITKPGEVQTTERDYIKAKLGIANNTTLVSKYENVFYPGAYAREALGGWRQPAGNNNQDGMSFGGMKNPKFYLLENCDCNAPDLIEQAQSRGKAYNITEVPLVSNTQATPNSCIISVPVPPSCTVSPNEGGAAGKDQQAPEQRLKWLGANGQLMDKALSEMNGYFQTNNAAARPQGCEGLSQAQIAQRIVNSVQCRGDRNLPHGANEDLDCGPQ